ncbi:MAG TPA: calcium/sodium antiporter [Candidatus Aminicenantes bacterium]|nr:calcium/sodium antiporter [Candidatus Aminicenantes bacterium]
MWTAGLAVAAGLALLAWSADRFVLGASSTAQHAGLPPLLIGMVVVGFGTSLPEMIVSTLAALDGNPDLGLGNGWGSNIANIALILGLAALARPVMVRSKVLTAELPLLTIVTLMAIGLVLDGNLARWESVVLLLLFASLMAWTIRSGRQSGADAFGSEIEVDLSTHPMPKQRAVAWTLAGLVLLAVSSRMLVWGSVRLARGLGVSELVIGLSIVALGTSLPELASAVAAVRRGENDIALGNVLGSNLFNTLAVVGLAGVIHPFRTAPEVVWRDGVVMLGLTVSLFVIGRGFRGRPGMINRWEGAFLLAVYICYIAWLGSGIVAK